ncbi:MAG: oligosaccharide flippase family protein [Thaumarchaeota archaeon]|nr:oligosaccharide flippase family protein [Nitrososphaerota archaeon]
MTEIAKRSTRGSVVLFAGNFVSTVFLAVSSIVIARLLGPASYGSYTLVVLIPQIIQLFVGLGVGSAITRFSAYHIARGEPAAAKRFSNNSMIFLMLFGVALSAVCYAGSGFLSAVVLRRAELAPLVRYASIAVLAQTALQASISGLVGWNSMGTASFASILQAGVRLCIAPVLVLSGFGVFGALTGYTAGYLVAGGAAAFAFYALKLRGVSGGGGVGGFSEDVREMVSYGLPIYAGGILIGLATYYVTILIAAIASDAVVGYYQAASNITVAYTLALGAITLALFPAFSSLHGTGADTSAAFRHATKYVAYMMAPVILFLVAGSHLILEILYGSQFLAANTYLVLLALAGIPLVVGSTVASAFFNGIGKTRLSLAVSAIGAGVLFVGAPLLGSALDLGVDGLIYAQLASNALAAVASLYFAWRYLEATVDLRSIGAIFGASVLGYAAMLLLSYLALPSLVALVADVVAFLFVYFTAAPLLGAIGLADVEMLGAAFEGLGVLSEALRPVLKYELLLLRRLRPG